MFDVQNTSNLGRVREAVAHGLRAALRAGVDGGGGTHDSRLARMAHVRTDSRRNGLRADVRDGFQPHRGPEVRRVESADGATAFARGENFARERLVALGTQRTGIDRGELFPQADLLLPVARCHRHCLLLLAHETVH